MIRTCICTSELAGTPTDLSKLAQVIGGGGAVDRERDALALPVVEVFGGDGGVGGRVLPRGEPSLVVVAQLRAGGRAPQVCVPVARQVRLPAASKLAV